jgi:hypothetical protein
LIDFICFSLTQPQIYQGNAQVSEILHISRHEAEIVFKGGGGDEAVRRTEGLPGNPPHAVKPSPADGNRLCYQQTRPENKCAKWRASDASRRARRAASRRIANPDSISPMLTTLKNNV